MSEESKKPPAFAPIPEYRPHFAAWVAIDAPPPSAEKPFVAETAILALPVDAVDALDDAGGSPMPNRRRAWTKPVLSNTPFARNPVPVAAARRESSIEEALVAESSTSELPLEPFLEEPAPAARATSELLLPEHRTKGSAAVYAVATASPPGAISPIGDAAAPPWSRDHFIVAAATIGVLLAILVTRPWKYFESVPSAPANLATQSLTKPEASPPMPSVAKSARKEASEPAKVAGASPLVPAAMPSIAPLSRPIATLPETAPARPVAASSAPARQTMPKINVATIPANHPALNAAPAESPSDDNEEDEPAQTHRTKARFAAVRGKLLEASIHSQLAQMGYASFGVAVSDEGDVYLEGTFLSQADQDRVLAMVRRFKHVRDISFSGSVWHTEHASADGAAEATASGTGDEAAPPPAVAKPAEPSASEIPAAQPKSAPSDEEFPITAADVPAPPNRYAAPLPTPSQSQSTSPLQ